MDQKTIEFRDPDHPAKIAWNFFTGLQGRSLGDRQGSCLVRATWASGSTVVLVRQIQPCSRASSRRLTSMGEGLVFRGPDFEWNPKAHESKTAYLKLEDAYKLVQFAPDKYALEMKQLPSRVVIHKSSRWTPAEKAGVREGLRNKVGRYDLVSLQG